MNLFEFGRFLAMAGMILLVIGGIMLFFDRLGIGRLPFDLQFGSERFKVFIPITTCILVSIVITVIINLFYKK
jgi:hypothetical protein